MTQITGQVVSVTSDQIHIRDDSGGTWQVHVATSEEERKALRGRRVRYTTMARVAVLDA